MKNFTIKILFFNPNTLDGLSGDYSIKDAIDLLSLGSVILDEDRKSTTKLPDLLLVEVDGAAWNLITRDLIHLWQQSGSEVGILREDAVYNQHIPILSGLNREKILSDLLTQSNTIEKDEDEKKDMLERMKMVDAEISKSVNAVDSGLKNIGDNKGFSNEEEGDEADEFE